MPDASLAGRRILVTGASGFIGMPLCRALVREGAEVHGTVRRSLVQPGSGVTWHQVDLTSQEDTEGLVADLAPQLIYHLAGRVTGVRDADAVLDVFHNTLTATVHVLIAAQRHHVDRVILPSSMEEPDGHGGAPIPSSPYAAAKWAAGAYGRMFASLYGLDVVELRVFMTYGPGRQDARKLVPAVILGLLRGSPPSLGSGMRRVDWVHVDDVVHALRLAAAAEVPPGTRPDVGSGETITIRAFAEQIARLVDPSAVLQFDPQLDRKSERETIANLEVTRELLGWEPRVRLSEGLAGVVRWYRERYEAGDFNDT
jgi:UDP-glucose 4-epimerase